MAWGEQHCEYKALPNAAIAAQPGDLMTQNPLFTPFTFKSLRLENRLVMAPMTRSQSPGGVLTEDMIRYYRRRAEGGVGLIVSEATGINRAGALNDSDVPRFYGDAALAAWAEAVNQVQQAGGAMVPQLWHVGATKGAARDRRPDPAVLESPSGIDPSHDQPFGHAMSDADIADTLAAADAQAIGCNGIEIHGAHGYLIDQFFWSRSNRRRDGYGGDSLLARSRFAVEMLQAVRRAVGPDFPVILRISQWKQQDYNARLAESPDVLGAWLGALVDAGADILHCSQRRFWEAEFAGSDLNLAGWAKKLTGAPTITVGSIGLDSDFMASLSRGEGANTAPLAELERRLARGDFDLVAVGRALLQDAHWVQKIRDGREDEIAPFDPQSLATLR